MTVPLLLIMYWNKIRGMLFTNTISYNDSVVYFVLSIYFQFVLLHKFFCCYNIFLFRGIRVFYFQQYSVERNNNVEEWEYLLFMLQYRDIQKRQRHLYLLAQARPSASLTSTAHRPTVTLLLPSQHIYYNKYTLIIKRKVLYFHFSQSNTV